MRSSLASIAPAFREPDEAHARRAAAAAWHEHGIALLNPEWFHAWTDRKQVELLAAKLFGEREGRRRG